MAVCNLKSGGASGTIRVGNLNASVTNSRAVNLKLKAAIATGTGSEVCFLAL